MKTAIITIKGASPLSQSRAIRSERGTQEQHAAFEERTWRERINSDPNGNVVIPAMAFKNCLSAVAKYLGMKIPGRRNATYTKHFEAGIIVDADMDIGIVADSVSGEWMFVPSDGKRGSGSRVWKCFPVVRDWGGKIVVHVIDETITPEAFAMHVEKAGQFIGVGRFRPQSNGFYGRFNVVKIEWV